MSNYVLAAGNGLDSDENDGIRGLLKEYERVLVESIITSFGLDIFITDKQHGGNVDTIHNVRNIGKDSKLTYKSAENKAAYENRGTYDSHEYHTDKPYLDKKNEYKQRRKEGNAVDDYTGKKLGEHDRADLDHIISAKEIHDDPGRVLAGKDGKELANSDDNFAYTNESINRSKKDSTMEEYLERWEQREKRINELKQKQGKSGLSGREEEELRHLQKTSDVDAERMRKIDRATRKAYDRKLNEYYTSTKFMKELSSSALKTGIAMGARQVLGLVFAEIWFSVKEELEVVRKIVGFELTSFFEAVARGIRKGFESAKAKFSQLLNKFASGAIAGFLGDITTTLCNIFFTTAKSAVRIIQQSWASITEAMEILFINPQNYAMGDRIFAATKTIAVGASVVAGQILGTAVRGVLANYPIIPSILQDIVTSFVSAFVTGTLSVTFVYILDRNPLVKSLREYLNSIDPTARALEYYKQQTEYFRAYAAKLMELDIEQFKKTVEIYSTSVNELMSAKDDKTLNMLLENTIKKLDITTPWANHDSFEAFLADENTIFEFK